MIRSLMSAVALAAAVTVLSGCTDPAGRRTAATATPSASASVSPSVSTRSTAPHPTVGAHGPYRVARVVAANRLDVVIGGRTVRVAALGLRGATGCRARRAAARARATLRHHRVYLTRDPAVRGPDRSGRRQAYVWVAGGLYPAKLLRAGYGRAVRHRPPLRYARTLAAAERTARHRSAGLWRPGTCATPTSTLTPRHTTAPKPKPHRTHAPRRTHSAPPAPGGASAVCRDHTFSYSHHRRGTCSHHHGVLRWLRPLPA